MQLSFVIPVYHGQETIIPLFNQIKEACDKYSYNFETIFIWDCGPDKSWERIIELKQNHPELVKGIKLSRNFGQHNAIICGFSISQGEFIVTMDEDLQHNPFEIIALVNKQTEGDYDVVYGNYPERKHNSFRNITSRILKRLLKIGIPELHPDYSAYRLIKKEVALSTLDMQNSYTFLDGYLSWITNSFGSVYVSHNNRQGGVSSYTIKKLINHSINIFVTFSNLPIKIVTWLSLLFFVFTMSYASYIFIEKIFFNNLIPGYASMIVLLGVGIGSILFGISVIGEYIHRINLKTTKRPNFMIQKEI